MSDDRSQRPVWLGQDRRGWDHVRVHVQLLRDDRLTAYHLAVYLGIAAHAELASGRAYPSAATLARYGGIGDRKVRDVIRDLEAWDYLTVERREGAASVYTLLPPPPLQEVQPSTGGSAPDAAPPRLGGTRTPAPGADEQDPGTRSNNQRARPPAAKAADVPGGDHPANRHAGRETNPCKQCNGDLHIEVLGGAMQQCPRCKGSGIDPSSRVA